MCIEIDWKIGVVWVIVCEIDEVGNFISEWDDILEGFGWIVVMMVC